MAPVLANDAVVLSARYVAHPGAYEKIVVMTQRLMVIRTTLQHADAKHRKCRCVKQILVDSLMQGKEKEYEIDEGRARNNRTQVFLCT